MSTLRGLAVGFVTATLAVAAHRVGGGPYPTGAQFALLLAVCSGLATVAATFPVGGRGWVSLVGALALGQAAAHLVLSISATPHSHSGTLAVLGIGGSQMLASHVVAVLACAALIAIAERLYGPLVTAIRPTLWAPGPLPEAERAITSPVRSVPIRAHRDLHLLRAEISRRGPPA